MMREKASRQPDLWSQALERIREKAGGRSGLWEQVQERIREKTGGRSGLWGQVLERKRKRSGLQKGPWGKTLDLAGNLLFPPRCPGCDELVPITSIGFCEKCRPQIELVSGPVCMKCGKKVNAERLSLGNLADPYREEAGQGNAANMAREEERNSCRKSASRLWQGEEAWNAPILCDDCRRNPHVYDSGRAVYIYQGIMKQAIYRFKYSNRRQYGRIFAKDAMKNPDLRGWLRMIGRPSVIIPVPMFAKKQSIRGYNQAAVFGRALGEFLGCECREDILTREVDTPALKTLAPEERKQALFRAFQCHASDVKLNRILLVDDIYTTGA
ncbi:MAG: double zinc ribbon domain-containing protein, partial [Lachnospiraceae bacterium]|nr:double zinc ribbon domain-containing protein [Lachnospiraceae bacterium]